MTISIRKFYLCAEALQSSILVSKRYLIAPQAGKYLLCMCISRSDSSP